MNMGLTAIVSSDKLQHRNTISIYDINNVQYNRNESLFAGRDVSAIPGIEFGE